VPGADPVVCWLPSDRISGRLAGATLVLVIDHWFITLGDIYIYIYSHYLSPSVMITYLKTANQNVSNL
jgi:hypothetical protein